MKASSEPRERRESEYAVPLVCLGLEVTIEAEQVNKTASDGSVREPRWTLVGEGMETDDCWRSERERRGRVTKPDSTPEEQKDYMKSSGR